MKNPELEKLIKEDLNEGADMADILSAVLDAFNKYTDNSKRIDLLTKDLRQEVAAVTATALYKAEELGV